MKYTISGLLLLAAPLLLLGCNPLGTPAATSGGQVVSEDGCTTGNAAVRRSGFSRC